MAHPGSAPLISPAMTRLEAAREVLRQMLLTDAQPAVRKAAVAAGVLVVLGASEAYSGSVTRTLRSIRRSIQAALAAWIEEQSGLSLLTPEGTLPLERPPGTALAWETLSAQDKAKRPGHAVTQAKPDSTVGDGPLAEARPRAKSSSYDGSDSSDTGHINFFATTKFFACLDLKESQELYEASQLVALEPHETLFETGDSSEGGIYVVVEGALGVFLAGADGGPRHTNSLHPGESVGDLDVLDDAPRSLTCMAMEEGALLVQIPQRLFLGFIASRPRTLQIYLQKAMARLWRVAHFVLNDFLDMPLPSASAAGHSASGWGPAHGGRSQQQGQPTRPRQPQPADATQAAHARNSSANSWGGSHDMGVAASPFSQVPENMAAEPQSAAASSSGHMGDAVIEARRALRSVQDVKHSVAESAQQALDNVEQMSAARPEDDMPPPSPGQQLDGPEMLVQHVVASESPEVQSEVGVVAMTAAAVAGGRRAADDAAAAAALRSVSDTSDIAAAAAGARATNTHRTRTFFGQPAAAQAEQPKRGSSHDGGPRRAASTEGNGTRPSGETPSPSAADAQDGQSLPSGAAAPATTPLPAPSLPPAPHAAMALSGGDSASEVSRAASAGSVMPSVASGALPLSTVGSMASATSNLSSAASSATGPAPLPQLSAAQALPEEQIQAAGQAAAAAMGAGGGASHSAVPRQQANHQTSSRPVSVPGAGQQSLPQHGDRGPGQQARAYSLSWAPEACLAGGWDVVAPHDASLPRSLGPAERRGEVLTLNRGRTLHKQGKACRRFYILLEGALLAERKRRDGEHDEAAVEPGSIVSAAAFLSGTRTTACFRAARRCRLLAVGSQQLDSLLVAYPGLYVDILLAAGQALAPLIRRFISLGLNRMWLHSGDTIYRQGDPAASLYILISGRARLVRQDSLPNGGARVEDEVARGEALGGVWVLTGGAHDTSAVCIRDSELVRMSKGSFEVLAQQAPTAVAHILDGMARRLAAAATARSTAQYDQAGKLVAESAPHVLPPNVTVAGPNRGSTGMKRGNIVTIALVPAGVASSAASNIQLPAGGRASHPHPAVAASASTQALGLALRQMLTALFGPTLHLTSSAIEAMFPRAFERIGVGFYRSKITSWMAAQEEDYRFIILEADGEMSPWSRLCVSQADCVLLVAAPDASPEMGNLERQLLWATIDASRRRSQRAAHPSGGRGGSGSLQTLQGGPADGGGMSGMASFLSESGTPDWVSEFRRVELVLLHDSDADPKGTLAWLQPRPQLQRHHHIRLANDKDMARLGRWMAGKAVGLVLSGGGSRGLAHLGVLHALDTAGVPVDVIGGTSQGAFMAALYAQGLAWGDMYKTVRKYAARMSSVQHLLLDLTLPLISLFTGAGFNRIVKESFEHGAGRIEDLWLNYFCVTTNLSKGDPSVHRAGPLWLLVRASMTIVGLVPPVFYEGDLLIDGGYIKNIPVDVMHAQGVDKVLVVDVEDRDDSAYREVTPPDIHGGVSGWRMLWDRLCPFERLRFGIKLPRYNQIVNALTWMSHSQALKRMSRDYVIDLYLRPPVWHFRLMDYHLMERIVRDSNRYAWEVISEWQSRLGGDLGARLATVPPQGVHGAAASAAARGWRGGLRRHRSGSCMTQLQSKHAHSEGSDGEAQPTRRRSSLSALQSQRWAYAETASSMPQGSDWMLGGGSPPGGSSPEGGSPLGTSPEASGFWGSWKEQQDAVGSSPPASQQQWQQRLGSGSPPLGSAGPAAAAAADALNSAVAALDQATSAAAGTARPPPPPPGPSVQPPAEPGASRNGRGAAAWFTDGSGVSHESLVAERSRRLAGGPPGGSGSPPGGSSGGGFPHSAPRTAENWGAMPPPPPRPVALPSPADMRRLASGRLPGGGARVQSADMQRAPSGRLPVPMASALSGAGSLRRGGSIVQSPSQLPPHMGGRSGSVQPRGQRAVSGRGRSNARSGGVRIAAGSSLAPPPAPSLAAAGVAAGGMLEDMGSAGTRLLHLSSIGEHDAEGATSSDLTSSADDAGSPPYRSRAGVSAFVGGRGRTQLPFERRGSGGGLAEDMRGAESGLLALQGGLDAEEGSGSDAEESGRDESSSDDEDDEGGSLAGTSTDGVLGAVEMDDDIVSNARVPGDSIGSGDHGPAGSSSGQPAAVGRRISFAEGLAEAASSGNGGAAKEPAPTAEAPQERSSWDGFKP